MKGRLSKWIWLVVATAMLVGLVTSGAYAAISQRGKVTTYTPGPQAAAAAIDFKNAIPMPLPAVNSLYGPSAEAASVESLGTPGVSPGFKGDGKTVPQTLPVGLAEGEESIIQGGDFETQEFGTSGHPFTTSRVDLSISSTVAYPSRWFPYRAAGKLYFKIGTATYVCSASLIKRGIIVTAAHCVANFGKQQFYSNWQYIPALSGTLRPYGTWNVSSATVLTSYFNGTDPCYQAGVVCTNDVAVLQVAPKTNPVYPGTSTGWFGYGYNGWGFYSPFLSTPIALINQLGYPASHDAGLRMQRTDSQGFVSNWVNNTVWGGRQTGGSSGGPELVNLGAAAALSGGVGYGTYATFNVVVGVTSWGYTNQAVKQQGASPFTSGNVHLLVTTVCGTTNPRCQ
jgi:hypothetical protein